MTAAGTITEPNRQAYRLATADGSRSILLNPDSVAVESRDYTSWADFREVIASLALAVAEVFDPATERRLGLRYIDQISLPDGHLDWSGLVHESLLGVTANEVFRDGVIATDARVLLNLDDGVRCVLRHGLLPADGGSSAGQYLLDFDVFRENGAFSAASAVEGADGLHQFVGRLFMACISGDLYSWLRG
jgi:uncharacterized protein (TIGR04255 family)